MQVVLFEDRFVADLRPITLTRPAFRITQGGLNLEKMFLSEDHRVSYLVREHLAPILALEYPGTRLESSETLFVNACMVPRLASLKKIMEHCGKKERFCICQGERVAVSYHPQTKIELQKLNPSNIAEFLMEDNPPEVKESLLLVNRPYEVVKYNMEIIGENLEQLAGKYRRVAEGVYVGKNVTLPKQVSYDVSGGLIIIDDNTTVLDFVLFRGPLYIGKNCKVNEHSAIKEECSVGDTIKLGGEVEASVIESFSNKQHHGFLGHAYVGSWINIGAGTSNSDLKNTYGQVNVVLGGKKEATGMQFLGCIMGDYSKTAINTSIFTGKIIGVCSLLFGFVTQNVPSFTNWAQTFGMVTKHGLSTAIRTQQRMFGRRKIEHRPEHAKLLEDVFRMTEDEHGPFADEPMKF